MDKATQQYWDANWSSVRETVFCPEDPQLKRHRERVLASVILRTLSTLPKGSLVLEAGCADSTILPWIAKQGFRIAGIDYSPIGCEKFKARLSRSGLSAEVECCDVFRRPDSMIGRYDAVVSFGLVEHFTDTAEIVSALAAFVRPGGRLLTVVPNMQGLVGLAQRFASKAVYDVHEAISVERLSKAHRGLRVIESGHLLPMDFGVVNTANAPTWRRQTVRALTALSYASWLVDGILPRLSWLSPQTYCIAEKS